MQRTTDLANAAYGGGHFCVYPTPMAVPNWQMMFMADAFWISGKSKDRSTKCGAVIVTPDNDIVTRGWNDHPRGLPDYSERRERPAKYVFTEHAERNAIYNAARLGVSTKGCSIYVNRVPCPDCARAIIQSGIRQVYACVAEDERAFADRNNTAQSLTMFRECMVELTLMPVEVFEFYDRRRYEPFNHSPHRG